MRDYRKSGYAQNSVLRKREQLSEDNRKAIKVKCKHCGHNCSIPAFRDYKICNWCGNKVLNDTKVHFVRKIKLLLEEEGK